MENRSSPVTITIPAELRPHVLDGIAMVMEGMRQHIHDCEAFPAEYTLDEKLKSEHAHYALSRLYREISLD